MNDGVPNEEREFERNGFPDGQLLQRARAGDEDALGEVLERYRSYLILVAERKLDPKLRAKAGGSDLVQQTFLEAHRGFEEFAGTTDEEMRAWLVKILNHNLADHQKRFRGTAKRDLSREISIATRTPGGTLEGGIPDNVATASSLVRRRERDETLEQAVNQLTPRHRDVIALRHQQNLAFDVIAAQMELSEQAARKLWTRAIRSLQAKLRDIDG